MIAISVSRAVRVSVSLADAVVSLAYPQTCRYCGLQSDHYSNGPICERCWGLVDSPPAPWNACFKCDQRLAALVSYQGRRFCNACQDMQFAHARSVGTYRGPLKDVVVELKRSPRISPRLVNLLLETVCRLPGVDDLDAMIPVPLHHARERQRGFNQAEIVASAISRRTGLATWSGILIKALGTERHRAGMDAATRRLSMRNAFEVRAVNTIRGRNLLVVDDIITTGATADEISNTLLSAGAQTVSVLSIAKAVHIYH